jgi:uncharacterized protein (TIGR00297 family)
VQKMLFSIAEVVSGGLFILALALVAVYSKTIDVPGAAFGALISFAAFLAGGLEWLVVIIAFFALSSLMTRFKYDYKRSLGSAQEKGGERSWPNTLANGLVAGLAALAEIATHQEIYIIAFLGTIAAAMSDTIATEVGLLSRSRPRLIVNLRKLVEPGTSGGVSLLGEIAGLASAVGITVLAFALKILTGTSGEIAAAAIAIVLGAFLATNLDSILGGTVQGMYRCRICGANTENFMHHGEPAAPIRGVRFLDNNAVNLIATFSAALISIALFLGLLRVLVP